MPRLACATCVFFVRMSSNRGTITRGKCRRYPPMVYFDSHAKQVLEIFPSVNENFWCGEFRRRRDDDRYSPTPQKH